MKSKEAIYRKKKRITIKDIKEITDYPNDSHADKQRTKGIGLELNDLRKEPNSKAQPVTSRETYVTEAIDSNLHETSPSDGSMTGLQIFNEIKNKCPAISPLCKEVFYPAEAYEQLKYHFIQEHKRITKLKDDYFKEIEQLKEINKELLTQPLLLKCRELEKENERLKREIEENSQSNLKEIKELERELDKVTK